MKLFERQRPDPTWVETLSKLHPHDISEQIRDLPIARIREVLVQLPDEQAADVIAECPIELQIQLFESMRVQRLSGIVEEMFSDDAVDVLGQISSQRLQEIMANLSPEDAEEIYGLLKYKEDVAGGIMRTEFLSVSQNQTIGEAIESLRRDEDVSNENLFYIYVTDEYERLQGVLKVRDLVFRRPEVKIKDVMVKQVRCVSVHADQEETANLFREYHFVILPVVDDFQRLRGVVTVDDVMDIMQEEATEDMQRMVGLTGEESVETPWFTSVRHRLPWLYVNLATAFLAGWVVSLFERTIAEYAVLAVFLPIIAGQGGNAGAQTLTILVRSLALGEVKFSQQRYILFKEILIGLMTGIATGFAVGFICWMWKGNMVLGVITGLAMILNLLVAAIAGVLIPLGLKALRIDPALASSIMLTTMTDVCGFFIFLSLSALGIHYLM